MNRTSAGISATSAATAPLPGEDGTVTGEGLPAGSYTLSATAYAEAAGGGAELGTLAVSFTVAASEPVDPDALTASFTGVPASHGGPGAEAFTFELAFSENPKLSYRTLRKWALWVTEGSLGFVRRLNPPSNAGWTIEVRPSGWEDVTVTLAGGGRPCVNTGAICTAEGKTLENSPVATVPGPLGAQRCGCPRRRSSERPAGVPGEPQPGGGGDGDGGLRDRRRHGDGGRGLHRGLGHADLPGGRDREDGERDGARRRA